MIIVKLQGGLGNQMFQYATGLSLSRIRKTRLAMDKTWYTQEFEKQYTPRSYELSPFKLNKKQKFVRTNKIFNNKYLYDYHSDSTFVFDKRVMELPKNTILEGYFQSEKYFKNIRTELINNFDYIKDAKAKIQHHIDLSRDSSSVSVHIRRGDYVTNKSAGEFHGILSKSYYQKAVKNISSKVNKPLFFIFSDDIAWVKKNLDMPKESIFIDFNKRGIDDMRIMRSCKHNIIANSSFSWWGAWLGEYENKIVIAPKNWFKSKELDTSDVIPARWIKI